MVSGGRLEAEDGLTVSGDIFSKSQTVTNVRCMNQIVCYNNSSSPQITIGPANLYTNGGGNIYTGEEGGGGNIYTAGTGNIYTAGTGNIYTAGSGKIGAGTSNPTHTLDVRGNANISGSLGVNTNLTVGNKLTVKDGLTVSGGLTVSNGGLTVKSGTFDRMCAFYSSPYTCIKFKYGVNSINDSYFKVHDNGSSLMMGPPASSGSSCNIQFVLAQKQYAILDARGYFGLGLNHQPVVPLDVGIGVKGTVNAYWTAVGAEGDGAYFITAGANKKDYFGNISDYSGAVGDGQGTIGDLDGGTDVTGIEKIAMSAHFLNSVYVSQGGYCSSSDKRIKKNIKDVNDLLALEVVRKIEPKYYNYIDSVGRHKYPTMGFIAQQVREVFPEAVKIVSSTIPNEMRKLKSNKISWEKIIEEEIEGDKVEKYKLFTDIQDVSGIKYRFYVNNDLNDDNDDEEIIDVVGNDDNSFTLKNQWKNIFCYGREVDDFHALDKEKIFTLYHASIQELDRQQQEHIKEIETLNNKIDSQQSEIDLLKTQMSEILTKINK